MKWYKDKKYSQEAMFMLQSNRIEGEDRLNPGDEEAIEYMKLGLSSLQDILNIHTILGKHLKQPWVGRLRRVNVHVGDYAPPDHTRLLDLMQDYVQWYRLPIISSFEAHNEFELIHPFQDLNGRVGRLIWLSKALQEGYKYNIPFLQAYYYQVLAREERKKG
jgi:Fic family protein